VPGSSAGAAIHNASSSGRVIIAAAKTCPRIYRTTTKTVNKTIQPNSKSAATAKTLRFRLEEEISGDASFFMAVTAVKF
jgi:hypothetical protein